MTRFRCNCELTRAAPAAQAGALAEKLLRHVFRRGAARRAIPLRGAPASKAGGVSAWQDLASLTHFVRRAEPRGLQQASYCMMMAPPPGPAHSIELRLTHGLCAGAGHGHAPQQHHAPPAYHAPPPAPLHSMEHDMPILFNDGEFVRACLRCYEPLFEPWTDFSFLSAG